MTKLKSTGDRINHFDNLTAPTVLDFNTLFPECPLPDGYNSDLPVSILQYMGHDRRNILVGSEEICHKMYRDILYGIDRDKFYEPDKDEPLDEMYGYPV